MGCQEHVHKLGYRTNQNIQKSNLNLEPLTGHPTNKLNTELQKKVAAITKTSEEGQKLMKKQLEDANKQNTELQKKLGELTESDKKTTESMTKMTEASNKMQATITKLTSENTEANKNLTNANTQIADLKRQLADSGGISKGVFYTVLIIAAIVILLLLANR